ncbi:MAG: FkbM family methyltransferase [Sideroxyarcus sp.]|nr:FkbM family methyltransferase [Sideroxyarcus sp.]
METSYDVLVTVPASLHCITTYVLLEQEQWFEREVRFLLRWLRSGMNVVDIGANVGVYSLPIARRVGDDGLVVAFEPGSKNRKHLESGRRANDLQNLKISACALSDAEKEGWLQFGVSAETNSLSQGSSPPTNGERVHVSTLDAQQQRYNWPPIDFVKIDAEGEEARIFAGGRDFLSKHSPLIMFEVRDEKGHNNALRTMLTPLGYDTYRLLGDASFLVPLESDEPPDLMELNLFAAKTDRAARLAEQGYCVLDSDIFFLSENERDRALEHMLSQPYARSFDFTRADVLECPYSEALIAYAAYRFIELPPGRRYSALKKAFAILSEFNCDPLTPAWAATMVRVALDLGRRRIAIDTLNRWHEMPLGAIDHPFFPPSLRYETLSPEGNEAEWFAAGFVEQIELSHSHSSCYASDPLDRLQWLCKSSFASAEISRRAILSSAHRGIGLQDLLGYINPNHHHQNAAFWSVDGLTRILALLQ